MLIQKNRSYLWTVLCLLISIPGYVASEIKAGGKISAGESGNVIVGKQGNDGVVIIKKGEGQDKSQIDNLEKNGKNKHHVFKEK